MILVVLAVIAGDFMGRMSAGAARAGMGGAVVWMLGWAWLVHRPAVAVEMIPVGILSRVEGFGGVPAFMFMLGVAWARSRLNRQRMLVAWSAAFGAVYFVNGGIWLLQDTPTAVMGHSAYDSVVLQSQDYSCVPASCATALNMLGVPSTEAQMAEYTDTRPDTGATVIRALQGLEERLSRSELQPRLREVAVEDAPGLLLPALAPLQYERNRRHMIVVVGFVPTGVWVMDPMSGLLELSWEHFNEHFCGQAIVFEGPRSSGQFR
ncbi:MAG: cysteine peptidase family C39 domain-containing protein [Algisphaera sp.]